MIIDELKGRRIAMERRLVPIGTKLRKKGFRISEELVKETLKLAGEDN